MKTLRHSHILADGRWQGQHGIGRFSTEVLSRLKNIDIISKGPFPLSIKNFVWQTYLNLRAKRKHYTVFFNPGFNPTWCSSIPFVFTIHDLIPLRLKHSYANKRKKLFFEYFIKPATKKAHKIITVSEYSKKTIIEWTNLPPEKIIVAPCGLSPAFIPQGERYNPGFPYLLHIGNTKEHKNVSRLIKAFAEAKIDPQFKLICTGSLSKELYSLIARLKLDHRVLVHTHLTEQKLASYYRGASGVIFPSLYEGFGLPIIEGMASGTPVLTSNVTSLPEVAGDAALLIDPYSVEAISVGITQLINDSSIREKLIHKGLERVKLFCWDKTAEKIQNILDAV